MCTPNFLFSLFSVFISLSFATSSLAVTYLDPELAALQATQEKLKAPKKLNDGRIQTLNKKGAMSPHIDPISKAFLKDACPKQRVLEIGSSYGKVAIACLKRNSLEFTANDLDERHLKILAKTLKEKAPEFLPALKLAPGDFPTEVSFYSDSFDAILIARVLHFFDPDHLKKAIKELYRIVKPGGKVYIIAITPYVRRFASFIPEYEAALKRNEPFPGFVSDLKRYADPEVTTPEELAQMHDSSFMFLDPMVLTRLFQQVGFNIEQACHFPLPYNSTTWSLDGRENVGLIAAKPL